MTWRLPWRPGLLALAMLAGSAGGVLAHALPGSEILLQQGEDGMRISVQFPLEDLVIAAPDLAALQQVPPGDPLPPEIADLLAGYLAQHLSLTDGTAPLPLVLSDAVIQSAYHDHLGNFLLVVSHWDVAGTMTSPGQLRLSYDAVMHEVRNHRATVHWLTDDEATLPIADFGFFHASSGIPLDLPENRPD